MWECVWRRADGGHGGHREAWVSGSKLEVPLEPAVFGEG